MKTTLTNGRPVTPDHRDINPTTGMQKAYVVLSAEERAKGFVQPVRFSYRHETCGYTTVMDITLAETYATDPGFYTGTYCSKCRSHFPVGENGEFVWEGTHQKVGTVYNMIPEDSTVQTISLLDTVKPDTVYKHTRTGGLYLVKSIAKMKSGDGEWQDCVVYYREEDSAWFVRDVENFVKNFELVNKG